jgi:penicillin-binding protein 1C
MMNNRSMWGWGVALLISFIFGKTYYDLRPIEDLYWSVIRGGQQGQIVARTGQALTANYDSPWNYHDQFPLHYFPEFMVKALILSEDKTFYHHRGVNWSAKAAAIWQNIKARRVVRGASTLTEQVVRLLTRRPRNLWSKWLETIEALLLERRLSKNHILEFYLNQVPFASNRHGMAQAARYYFNRDLSTLTAKEILSLIILIQAPSSYDLKKSTITVEKKLQSWLGKLVENHILSETDRSNIQNQRLVLEAPKRPPNAYHFIHYLNKHHQTELALQKHRKVRSTLDASLQDYVQKILDQRIRFLRSRQVHNGAVLVVDHTHGEVLAWVVAGASLPKGETPAHMVDAVTALRQPGSALKPFVYAMALQKGWQTTTIIEDAPLTGPVGCGMHKFKNYSNIHYGPVTLREALANSLNVPAVKTIQFVGVENFLTLLKRLGFAQLQRSSDVYEEGLALGNGEVTLLELVEAYTILANKGRHQKLKFFLSQERQGLQEQIFPDTVTSIISDILSDGWARRLEFGASSVMNLPIQTAIKTGTSSDYRDAWIVGYNHKYVVGIWMGNLDNTPMDGITGSIGPALTLRSIFSYLNRNQESKGLYVSSDLVQRDVFIQKGEGGEHSWQTELFSINDLSKVGKQEEPAIKLVKPTPGLRMAIDPRVPLSMQKFEFKLTSLQPGTEVEWFVDGQRIALTKTPSFLWNLVKGKHYLKTKIYKDNTCVHQTEEVGFVVK